MAATALTKSRTRKAAQKAAKPKKVVVKEERPLEEIIARMDELLPKWRAYTADRKAGKAKRRHPEEFAEWEHLYRVLRERGFKLADARKKVAKS